MQRLAFVSPLIVVCALVSVALGKHFNGFEGSPAEQIKDLRPKLRKMIVCLAMSVAFISLMLPISKAQGFNSGSTGADGPLDLSTLSCVTCQVQLPESGIFNYTTVNVPSGKVLQFKPNLRNTPVIMLAQGAVTINGTIRLQGGINYTTGASLTSAPGPGGFPGGAASGQNGFGPGGGNEADSHGRWIGPLSLVPIIGGSGGRCCLGGGGGGAIVIASSASVTVTSTGDMFAQGSGGSGGGGSGGAIRLVANSLNVSGILQAFGSLGVGSASGHPGVIRLEAPAGSLSFTGSSNPDPIISTTINPAIIADNTTAALTITSIAGFAVPSYTTGRPDIVDLLLPTQLADPISVVVHGHNIPVGTQVNMSVSGSAASVTPGTLSGSLDSSTATLSVSGLSRTAASTLYAFATFTPPTSSANAKGPDQVAKVRVEAPLGGNPRFFFLRSDGTVIDKSKVPRTLLEQFPF